MNRLSRVLGCIYGVAVGDALGAPVEFLSAAGIRARYGPAAITGFVESGYGGPGLCTDDTQMALATAHGCLSAVKEHGRSAAGRAVASVYQEYLAWLETQNDPHQRRAPGNTCIGALRSGRMGTLAAPLNTSKGCGGVMRTAPVGLLFSPGIAFKVGAECAAITHGHPSGFLPVGFVAELVAALCRGESMEAAVSTATSVLVEDEGRFPYFGVMLRRGAAQAQAE